MVESILEIIKKDIEVSFDLHELKNKDKFTLHFGVCLYIRNSYLWHNKFICDVLNKKFKTKDVDSLSFKILDEILKEF